MTQAALQEAVRLAQDLSHARTHYEDYCAHRRLTPAGPTCRDILALTLLEIVDGLSEDALVHHIAMPAVLAFPTTFTHEMADARKRAGAIRASLGLEASKP